MVDLKEMSNEELLRCYMVALITKTDYNYTKDCKSELLFRLKAGEKAAEKLADVHDWYCGCGHWNGANLSHCADCGRKPNES